MKSSVSLKELTHFINGRFVSGTSGRFVDVYDPSTGEVIVKVPLATRGEVQQAIDVAQAAFPSWRDTSVAKRAQVLLNFRNL